MEHSYEALELTEDTVYFSNIIIIYIKFVEHTLFFKLTTNKYRNNFKIANKQTCV